MQPNPGTSTTPPIPRPVIFEVLGIICETPIAYNVTGGGVYCWCRAAERKSSCRVQQARVTYALYRAGNPTPVATVSGTGGQISFGYFTTVGAYFVVATRNSGGCSAAMNNTVAVSLSTTPGAPTGLLATDTVDDKTKLDWTAPGDTVTGYNVKRSTSAGGTYTTIGANVRVNVHHLQRVGGRHLLLQGERAQRWLRKQ